MQERLLYASFAHTSCNPMARAEIAHLVNEQSNYLKDWRRATSTPSSPTAGNDCWGMTVGQHVLLDIFGQHVLLDICSPPTSRGIQPVTSKLVHLNNSMIQTLYHPHLTSAKLHVLLDICSPRADVDSTSYLISALHRLAEEFSLSLLIGPLKQFNDPNIVSSSSDISQTARPT